MSDKIKFQKIPPAWVMKGPNKLRQALVKFSRKLQPSALTVFDMVTEVWVAKSIAVAAELNIADHLAEAPKTISELASLTKTNEDALYRLMRLLASNGVFREKNNKTFVMTPAATGLLEGSGSMKYMVISHMNDSIWKSFGDLKYCIETGNSSAEKLFGKGLFDHLSGIPEENDIFAKAMSNTSDMAAAAIFSSYNFSGFKKIIDVGGGQGALLSAILYKNPNAEGVVFDLPATVEGATINFERFGVQQRVKTAGGSFFDAVPQGGDLYILKNILHDWDDEKCITILKNIHKAMLSGAHLILIESVIMEDNEPSFAKLSDMLMLVGLTGARERTLNEYQNLLEASGFNFRKYIPTVAPFSLIEVVGEQI